MDQPETTRRMVEMIRDIRRNEPPGINPYLSRDTANYYQNALDSTTTSTPTEERQDILSRLGSALLQAGEPERALEAFQSLEKLMLESSVPSARPAIAKVWRMQALCQLRLGEQENCLHNHNAESCLFPIQGGGIHKLTRGSRAAIDTLHRLLEVYPGDLSARWLLNIAYMTLGEYPENVPQRFLIPPSYFASEDDIGWFPDVAGPLGLDVDDLAGGVVMEDFDKDGFLDLMVSGWGFESQLRVFRNNGDGSFSERTQEAGLSGLCGSLNLIHGDYDNDGFMDVLMLRGAWLEKAGHYPNSLLRNNGDFTFTDVTEQAGMLSFHPTQTATWFDYNGDGWLDVFVGNESTDKDEHPCELYRNNGDGTFTECAALHGLDITGFVKGVTSGDFNNDGRPDLFFSTLGGGRMLLLRNDGPTEDHPSPRSRWRFTDVTKSAGLEIVHHAFPCWFWDYDNDGWLDLAVPGYSIQDVGDVVADYLDLPHAGSRMRLYRNNRDGSFSDVSDPVGVHQVIHAMGANYGDLDNDGWLDFYLGTGDPDFATLVPNRMFRNDVGRRFRDVTASGGFGQLQKGHGIAFGDIDNDGDLDIYSVVGGAVLADNYHNQLFANPGHGNHWIKLDIEGAASNRAAIGARVKLVVETPRGDRELHRVVSTGGSFGSAPLRQEIGLGAATGIKRVEVFWPVTGKTQTLAGLALDRAYRVREDAEFAEPVHLRSFELPAAGSTPGSHQHHATRSRALPEPDYRATARAATNAELCGPSTLRP